MPSTFVHFFSLSLLLSLVYDVPAGSHAASSPHIKHSFQRRGGDRFDSTVDINGRARTDHVRHVLSERLHQVLSGTRAKSFVKWALKQDVIKVLSTHGSEEVDVNDVLVRNNSSVEGTNKLFLDDVPNLDLVPNADIPSEFPGKPLHLIDDRPPSIFELLVRSIRLSFNFTPVIWTSWLAMLSRRFRNGPYYRMVALCLASSGPAFIKWGQWASTRSDMFPEELCEQLSMLHSDAPAHRWRFSRMMVESSLGLPKGSLLEVFESFDQEPLASGSIAQIHKAVLRRDRDCSESGTLVAVKIRHPNVAKLIDMDFRLMNMAAAFGDLFPSISWLHIRDSVEQFSHTMAAQAHLDVEAHHLEVLNHNFRNWRQVNFPRPFFASSSVILETFEPGRIVTDILDLYDTMAKQVSIGGTTATLTIEEVEDVYDDETTKYDEEAVLANQFVPISVAKFIVTTGLSMYLKMLLVDGIMHADLHPGNIMLDILRETTKAPVSASRALLPVKEANVKRDLSLTLVDAGMVAQLTKEESTNFIGLICCLGSGDGRLAAEFALRFSIGTALNGEERQCFIDDMVGLFAERCRGYGTNVDVGHVLRGVLGLIRKHQVRIDANYATLVINVLCIESLGRRVCPSYNVLDAAKPLLESYKGLCYDGKGHINENPSSAKKALVNLCMPIAYASKSASDNAFFNKQKRFIQKQRHEHQKAKAARAGFQEGPKK